MIDHFFPRRWFEKNNRLIVGDVVWGETCFFAFVGECVLYNFAKLACYFLAVARRMKTERAWNEHVSLAQLFFTPCNFRMQHVLPK